MQQTCNNMNSHTIVSSLKDKGYRITKVRKEIIEIFPLDFEEFLIFKGKNSLVENLGNIKKLSGGDLMHSLNEYYILLEEFMVFGGYPEVVLKYSKEEKQKVLASIFDLYVKKDLLEYLKVEKILNVKRLIEFLAVNNGQKIKYEELSQVSGLTFQDTKRYIEILSETYLIEEVRPFFTNKNKELVKIHKIYFIDNGVRNYFINNFNNLKLRDDRGYLFEGFVFSELIKHGQRNLKFWNDKNLEEVDFILEKDGNFIPIEIKFKEDLKSNDFSGLNNFLKVYKKTKKAVLVNLAKQKKEKGISLLLPYIIGRELCSKSKI